MLFINRIKQLLSSNGVKPVIYDEMLSSSYMTGSVTASFLKDKRLLIIHNGGSLHLTIENRLKIETADVTVCDYSKEPIESYASNRYDCIVSVIEWIPLDELLRLKTISKDTYASFMKENVLSGIMAIKELTDKNSSLKYIMVCPLFAMDLIYGYSLYGIGLQRFLNETETIINKEGLQHICVLYANTVNADYNLKADISSAEGVLHHVVLREQVASVVTMLCGFIGDSIRQKVIRVGAI